MNRSVIVACATLALVSVIRAEDQTSGPGPAEPAVQSPASAPANHPAAPGATYRAAAGVTHQFSTDLKDLDDTFNDASFSMTRYGASVGVSYPISNVQLTHALTYEYDRYDFDGRPRVTPNVVG